MRKEIFAKTVNMQQVLWMISVITYDEIIGETKTVQTNFNETKSNL